MYAKTINKINNITARLNCRFERVEPADRDRSIRRIDDKRMEEEVGDEITTAGKHCLIK